jgi:ribbon-helix-helix CopG family protein
MAGKTVDPKPHRVTLRLSESDLRLLRRESARLKKSIGNVIRVLIRQYLPARRAARRS